MCEEQMAWFDKIPGLIRLHRRTNLAEYINLTRKIILDDAEFVNRVVHAQQSSQEARLLTGLSRLDGHGLYGSVIGRTLQL